MKHLLTLFLAIAFAAFASGQQPATNQQLVTNNSDVVGASGWLGPQLMVQNGPRGFFSVGGAYYTSVSHPSLPGVDPDYQNIYFISYDDSGNPLDANFIRGTYEAKGAYTFDGGITLFGSASDNVTANDSTLYINQASTLEFLATYNSKCQLENIVSIWEPGPAFSLYTVSMMDQRDGSIYLAGSSDDPLYLKGRGMIGENWDNYFYVLKYDQNLVLREVFTAGLNESPGTEYGQYGRFSFAIAPCAKGSVIITGTYEGDRGPAIDGDTLQGDFNSTSVFAVKLDPRLKKEWVLGGTLNEVDDYGNSRITGGIELDNGDVVLVGSTSTGYFSLGDAEFKFDNGYGYSNLFAFRMSPDRSVQWERPLQTMVEQYYGEYKGTGGNKDARETQSEQFSSYIDWDAIQWNEEILYMTGIFMGDGFEINGRAMNSKYSQGAFVAAMDMESGDEKWGYALSSDFIHLHGFDLDASGNPSLMGTGGYLQDFDYLGSDSLGTYSVFHMGLDYTGKPLWKNNAHVVGNVYGFEGNDLEVLDNGKVFTTIRKDVQDPLMIGGALVSASETYSAMLIALDVNNMVGGLLFSKSGATVNPGRVRAYKSTESGPYPVVSEANVDASGYYLFKGLFPGKYKFLAAPDPKAYPDGMPTYYGGAVSWDQARDVVLETDTRTTFTDITLSELPRLTAEDGSGRMSGNVSYEDEVTLKGTKGEPVTKTSVILKKKQQAIKKSTTEEDIVAYVDTDDLGNYEFDNVPDGAYTLIVDIPGLPMIQTYEVEILANKIISGLNFLVKKKGIETSGSVDVARVALDKFMIFPNPGKDLLNIEFTTRGDYSVQVYNMVGRLIDSRDYRSVAGLTQLDISHLQRGMYLLRIEGDQGVETVKYMKE